MQTHTMAALGQKPPMQLLAQIQRGPDNIENTAFASSPIRIGRNQLNEIVLEEPFVSQWHAVIRFDANDFSVTDLGSTNGTKVHGRRLERQVQMPMADGDMIEIGTVRIVLRRGIVPPHMLTRGSESAFDTRSHQGRATMFASSAMMAHSNEAAPRTMFLGGAVEPPPEDPKQREQLLEFVKRTGPAYQAYRAAWTEVLRQVRARLTDAAPEMRTHVALELRTTYPQLAREPEFAKLLDELDLDSSIAEVDVAGWLERLTGAKTDTEAVSTHLAMERIGALLEVFAQSFVELRKGYEQFGEDMALQVVAQDGPLTQAKDKQEALAHLLDWEADGGEILEQLKRAFADLGVHQVAVLHGVVEGARSILHRLSPKGVRGGNGANALATRDGGGSFLEKLPFLGSSWLWRRYQRLHSSVMEEDRFTRDLFGRAFGRAYFLVAGGGHLHPDSSSATRSQ